MWLPGRSCVKIRPYYIQKVTHTRTAKLPAMHAKPILGVRPRVISLQSLRVWIFLKTLQHRRCLLSSRRGHLAVNNASLIGNIIRRAQFLHPFNFLTKATQEGGGGGGGWVKGERVMLDCAAILQYRVLFVRIQV